MTRSRIGPLALEAPLGGARSNLFRAIHVQQRIPTAVRLFPFPMGMTPEAKQDFSDKLERLKALRHPHLVRCYGGGFDAKDAYLVYEWVEGESLSDSLKRRQRLAWEAVLELGLQMCNALQYVHEAGFFHGRIRPDKILVAEDGIQHKLNDLRFEFGSLTPPTIEDMAYCPPESFAEQPRVDASWDLYALGATMYHALTGQPPFVGENASMVRHAIMETSLPAVATIVFDCPVWLSSIVEQLLNRDPLRRPYSAAAAAMALHEAQRRATEGIGVVEHVVSGFSPLQMNSDRAEAERVLGITKKKKRRSREQDGEQDATSLWEKPSVLLACLALLIGVIVYLAWPLNEAQLRQRAETLMASEDAILWNDARDKYLLPMLDRFPNGRHVEWAMVQLDLVEMRNAEDRMRRNLRVGREPASEGERKYSEALRFERFGDRVTALDKYQGIVKLLKDVEKERPFVNLAKRQIAILESNPPSIEELRRFLNDKLTEAETLYANGDVLGARQIWEGIVSLYNGNQEMVSFVDKAQRQLDGKSESTPNE